MIVFRAPLILALLTWTTSSATRTSTSNGKDPIFDRLVMLEKKVDKIVTVVEQIVDQEDSEAMMIMKMKYGIEQTRTDISKVKGDLGVQIDAVNSKVDQVKTDLSNKVEKVKMELANKVDRVMKDLGDENNQIKKDTEELLKKPMLVGGWLYKGRGWPATYTEESGSASLSFPSCVQKCEGLQMSDPAWNGMSFRVKDGDCWCYKNARGHTHVRYHIHFQTEQEQH